MSETYDPHDPIGVPKPRGFSWWLQGRASRREYWTSVALLFGVGLAMEYFPGGPQLETGLGAVLILFQVRRIHDFGRSGWWAVAATLAPAILPLPLVAFDSFAAIMTGLGLELLFLVMIGALPGNPHDNRFGPPPPFTAKRVLTGR